MVKEEKYNEIIGGLVDHIKSSEYFDKDKKIICCTNGHSPLAYELESLGYNAREESVKKYDGKCDIVIVKTSDTDMVRIMNKTDEKTLFVTMYNRLFTGESAKKVEKYFLGTVGEGVNVSEEGRNEPFDNRLFLYWFGGK